MCLSDNGSGVDWDPDTNDTYNVTQVNGAGFTAGTPFALPSGALLTMNADGTFDYDPNGQFESLAVGQTATDTSATRSTTVGVSPTAPTPPP